MADTEDIITNPHGGKQSKLYAAYHLIDPYALQALAAVHHRGAIKYAPDNWRKIPTEEHLNHALHHIIAEMKILLSRRLDGMLWSDTEDHLAHALCRLTFALAMEVDRDGQHPEHSDPTYHEPKTPSPEPRALRDDVRGVGPIPPVKGFDERARSFATLVNSARRNDLERPPKIRDRKASRPRKATLYSRRGRRRPTTHRRK